MSTGVIGKARKLYTRSRGGGGGGGGDFHIKVTGSSSYLLGVKNRGLVPLRVLKSKITSGRGMAVPFRILSRKI